MSDDKRATAYLKDATLTKNLSSINNCFCLVLSIGENEVGFFQTNFTTLDNYYGLENSVLYWVGEKDPYTEHLRSVFDDIYRNSFVHARQVLEKFIRSLKEGDQIKIYDFLKQIA